MNALFSGILASVVIAWLLLPMPIQWPMMADDGDDDDAANAPHSVCKKMCQRSTCRCTSGLPSGRSAWEGSRHVLRGPQVSATSGPLAWAISKILIHVCFIVSSGCVWHALGLLLTTWIAFL